MKKLLFIFTLLISLPNFSAYASEIKVSELKKAANRGDVLGQALLADSGDDAGGTVEGDPVEFVQKIAEQWPASEAFPNEFDIAEDHRL